MKQIFQSYRTGELWLAQVPAPSCKSAGVVVQTTRSLVSAGTERMVMQLAKKSLVGKARARPDLVKQILQKVKTEGWTQTLTKVFAKLNAPLPLGYSIAGVVQEVGRHGGNFRVGDRVACGGAGYASHSEYNFVPRNLCVPIPEGVGDEAASFTTLGAIAMQGVRQTDPHLGEVVGVVGLGLLGLITVQLLKAAGCAVVGMDLDPSKCDLAKKLGADEATSPQTFVDTLQRLGAGHGADAVIITAATSSNGPIETAAEATRQKGRVVVVGLVGMDIPRDPFYKKELDLRLSMSYGPGRYDPDYEEAGRDYPYSYVRWTEQRNMQSFLYLLSTGAVKVDELISHRFALDDALGAYQLLEGKAAQPGGVIEKYLGIVLEYPQAQAASTLSRRKDFATPVAAPTSGDKVGLGLLGAGNFLKGVLLPAFSNLEQARLVGVCASTGSSAEEVAQKVPVDYTTTQAKQLLDDPAIHAVIIATPHNSHGQLALDALKAGKAAFVEKPLCLSPDELKNYQQYLEQANGKSPILTVGFNRRFSPHGVALHDAFATRQTAMVVSYRINAGVIPRDTWIQNPEVGGGRIVGEMCHFVDFCQYLVGSHVAGVQAASVRQDDGRYVDEDSVVVTLTYADGSLATIQYVAHGSNHMPKERCEVFADGNSAIMDNFVRTDFFGSRRKSVRGKQAKGFAEEARAFVQAVHEGGDWPIAWESLENTTQTTFAILAALRDGSSVDPRTADWVAEDPTEPDTCVDDEASYGDELLDDADADIQP